MPEIFTTVALKLHAYGLAKLYDPNWTGSNLFYNIKDCWKGRDEPTELLFKTIEDGLLFKLGHWFFNEYFFDEDYIEGVKEEYFLWYFEDFYDFLIFHGADKSDDVLMKIKDCTTRINKLYEKNEGLYYKMLASELTREKFLEFHRGAVKRFESIFIAVSSEYAANYADRVFHDRELCGYISELLVFIGFDGMDDPNDTEPQKWVKRLAIPQRARDAVISRDRNSCAICETNIVGELRGKKAFDHIIPIAKGGCNDLVNLQLLCESCNLKKKANLIPVRTSIPSYFVRKKK